MQLPGETEDFLIEKINQVTGLRASFLSLQPVGGGSINKTYKLLAGEQSFFLKVNDADRYPGLFEKEKNGLLLLGAHGVVGIPVVVYTGINGPEQFLLLEWVNAGLKTERFWTQFGESLARLHYCNSNRFGLAEDNYIGALPQQNNPARTWTEFFIGNRLQPQVEMAARQHL